MWRVDHEIGCVNSTISGRSNIPKRAGGHQPFKKHRFQLMISRSLLLQ
jgi:hypothetical protein